MIILAINPGSTSTKVALFENLEVVFTETIRHSVEELEKFESLNDQIPFRKELINDILNKYDVKKDKIDGFIGRGGLMKPLKSGIYEVNDLMEKDLMSGELALMHLILVVY